MQMFELFHTLVFWSGSLVYVQISDSSCPVNTRETDIISIQESILRKNS